MNWASYAPFGIQRIQRHRVSTKRNIASTRCEKRAGKDWSDSCSNIYTDSLLAYRASPIWERPKITRSARRFRPNGKEWSQISIDPGRSVVGQLHLHKAKNSSVYKLQATGSKQGGSAPIQYPSHPPVPNSPSAPSTP